MNTAERMLKNSQNAFKNFILFSTENELENILSEIDFEALKKILRASKKIYDKKLSKKYWRNKQSMIYLIL